MLLSNVFFDGKCQQGRQGLSKSVNANMTCDGKAMISDEKVILCYGDSNTYGQTPIEEPGEFGRYDRHTRWPGVMSESLGEGFHVIEEGLSARTTVHTDAVEGEFRNGLAILPAILETNMPIDIVILMLGTNDLKARFGVSAFEISIGVQRLVQGIQKSAAGPGFAAPSILLISPPNVYERSFLTEMFAGARAKSKDLAEHFQNVANVMGTEFMDAATLVDADTADGVHLTAASHRILGVAVADKIRDICAD